MTVRFKKHSDLATVPTYGTACAAGADLYAATDKDTVIPPHETVMIPLGFSIEIPDGYCGLIFARSGIASKRGLAPANKVGVVDSDYRGECMVALHNHSEKPQTVAPKERIAQLVITPFLHVDFEESDDLSSTDRGAGGFGSTGSH
ncbi:MAG: dUTP diphosphatase [Clostridia bacterium]|nr:dUTP diphosphatase [Clostridia bacterium]